MNKRVISAACGALLALSSATVPAANYVIDHEGQHASINFKISHLGFSWIYGRFNHFTGTFSWDPQSPEASKVNVEIDTASVDSNHTKRDNNLRSDKLLNVDQYPNATFVSTRVHSDDGNTFDIIGDLTLNGVTREVIIDAHFIGEGKDLWEGYRAGFEGTTRIKLKDYNIMMDLGPTAQEVELFLTIEGIRQQ